MWKQAEAIRDAGGTALVFCPAMRGHRAGRRVLADVEVRYLRFYEGTGPLALALEGLWNTLVCLAQLPRLRRSGVRSVQVCNPPDTLFGLLAICRMMGMQTVYDQHDVAPAMASTHPGLRRLRPIFAWFERWTVRAADIVVTSSETQRERLQTLGCDATVVRSPPVDDDPVVRETQRSSCHLGYLGVIGRADGLDDLIDAVELLRDADAMVSLTIAGDGPFRPHIERLVHDRGLGGSISLAGWLRGDELEAFLDSIDAMVVSDPESEYNHFCAMNKTMEAMARQIPVIMRPLRENRTLTGDHRWITDGWTTNDLADAILDFAHTGPDDRQIVAASLGERYRDSTRWAEHRERYLGAVLASHAT